MKNAEGQEIKLKLNIGFFEYITVPMIVSIIFLALILVVGHDKILEAYHENIPLNSMIFGVILFSIFKSFWNNVKLYKNIKFLRRIENIEGDQEVAPEELTAIGEGVSKEGYLFNVQNMYNALENLAVYGHLNFTDQDARLIKSKFGNRIKSERQVVSYFAGLLVMMGLIGTFWGLLSTINAVGEALNQVSGGFGNADKGKSAGGGIELGKFIGSIAAPLQGMGIAFSASLFGIGGSLFLGFLNFFSTHAQDKAIEMVSRWIDARIPTMNPALKEKVMGQKVPKSDDLKAWLAGFVYLSSKTNQKMGQIMIALSKTTEAMLKSAHHTEKLYDYQKDIYMAMETMSSRMAQIKDGMKYITRSVEPMLNHSASTSASLSYVTEILASNVTRSEKIYGQQVDQIALLSDRMRDFNSVFERMNQIQGMLVNEIEKMKERTQKEDASAEFTSLVWQLNTIVEEIQQKNANVFDTIFEERSKNDAPSQSE